MHPTLLVGDRDVAANDSNQSSIINNSIKKFVCWEAFDKEGCINFVSYNWDLPKVEGRVGTLLHNHYVTLCC